MPKSLIVAEGSVIHAAGDFSPETSRYRLSCIERVCLQTQYLVPGERFLTPSLFSGLSSPHPGFILIICIASKIITQSILRMLWLKSGRLNPGI